MQHVVLTVLLLAITAIWGWTFTVVKQAVDSYGVVGFLALRFSIASALLATIALPRLTKRSLVTGAGIGVFLASGYLLQTFGLRYTTATNCGLITGLFVVFAPLVNRWLFGVRTSPVFWGAVALSLVGLVLLTGAGPTPLNKGDLLTLGAALAYGVHISLLDRYAKEHDAIALALVQVAAATVIFLTAWPVSQPMGWPDVEVWSALIITGVLATAISFVIQTYAQQRVPAVRAAVIFSMEPVFAILFGYLLAGDRLAALQILGAVVMIGAVLIAEVGPAIRRQRAKAALALASNGTKPRVLHEGRIRSAKSDDLSDMAEIDRT